MLCAIHHIPLRIDVDSCATEIRAENKIWGGSSLFENSYLNHSPVNKGKWQFLHAYVKNE